MPRHDWRHDDDLMSRERSERRFMDDRGFERDRGAFFGRDRERDYRRAPIGGWGGLMGDEDRTRGLSVRERSGNRGEQRFGPDDRRSGIARDETERLIASNKVEGTPVFDRNGERLGSIHNFMVDKFRGRVVYAVLRHSSGFLGLDDRYYPLDWDQLTFDTRLGGYHLDLTEDQLMGMGSWDRSERWQERGSSGRDRFERDRMEHERFEGGRDDYRPDYARGMMREPW